jgi:Cucumopine synthase C-terminal helical bundle domain
VEEIARLRKEVDNRTQSIWLEEPDEIKKLRMGTGENGAGSYGQYFTTYVFVDGEVRALGYLCYGSILSALSDEEYALHHIRGMAKRLLPVCAEFLGYCGLESLWNFTQRYLEAIEECEAREEIRELTRSMMFYVNRMHGWLHFYAPWGLGTQFRFKTREETRDLERLLPPERQEVVSSASTRE